MINKNKILRVEFSNKILTAVKNNNGAIWYYEVLNKVTNKIVANISQHEFLKNYYSHIWLEGVIINGVTYPSISK
jgi:hypothetical protein